MGLKIAIIGRPNVGKSTLFNRLAGRKLAIVDDTPGVTRDRKEAPGEIHGLPVTLIDTAGYEEVFDGGLEDRMRQQTEIAIEEADVCLFLIDARAGVTTLDETFAALLRRAEKPVILCANKCEGRLAEAGRLEAFSLGLGEPIALSAEHGQGLVDVAEALRDWAFRMGVSLDDEEEDAEPGEEGPLRLAIVGRPNVGKSTLINTLLGEDRLLTGPEAGITRDSISVEIEHGGRQLLVYDTAGMRRRARVQKKLETLSVGDTIHAIRFADVVILLMDAQDAFEKQDLQIADLIIREGRALVLGINKWDTVDDRARARAHFEAQAENFLPQVRGVPLITVSGETGFGLDKLLNAAFGARDMWNSRVTTGQLNRWLEKMVERHPPPAVKGRRIKLRYMTQASTRPPTFIVFSQRAGELPDDYRRYLISGLRDAFGLKGVPIRLNLRSRENPYAAKAAKRT